MADAAHEREAFESSRDARHYRGVRLPSSIKALSSARVTSNQIESARKVLTRAVAKTGKLWIRIFPDRPVTAKPAEVGMGSGKGDPKHYVFEVRPARAI